MAFASSRPEFVNQPASGLAIDINGLSKTYQGSRGKPPHLALDAVDLHVPVGCIFGLLGILGPPWEASWVSLGTSWRPLGPS